jgi:hypothetical protein
MEWLGELGSAILGAAYANRIGLAVVGAIGAGGIVWLARRRRWLTTARRHPGRTAAAGLTTLAIAGPIGWYLASPLVLSASVDEPPPIVDVAATPSRGAGSTASPSVASGPGAPSIPATSGGPPSVGPSVAPSVAPPPLAARAGSFHGSDEFHFGEGRARLIETSPGAFVVRLEDFAVRNGPDLYVYLSPSSDGYADGAIEVGRLKADRGNQNYPVPRGAFDDPAEVASVVIWCKQFRHLFATAPLSD